MSNSPSAPANGNGSENGFVQLRRGLLDHIRTGEISNAETKAFIAILIKADYNTGVWMGNSKLLGEECHWSEGYARKVLVFLEGKKYISRPEELVGFNGVYPIKIEKYFRYQAAPPGPSAAPPGPSAAPPGPSAAPPGPSAPLRSSILERSKEFKEVNTHTNGERVSDFEQFWKIYPRQSKKPSAQMAWFTVPGIESHAAEILAGVERWKISAAWQRENGRFIPLPENFLRNRVWADPVDPRRDPQAREAEHDRIIAKVNADEQERRATGRATAAGKR